MDERAQHRAKTARSPQRRSVVSIAAGRRVPTQGADGSVAGFSPSRERPNYFVASGTSRVSLRAASKRFEASSQFQQFQTTSKNSVLRFSYWR